MIDSMPLWFSIPTAIILWVAVGVIALRDHRNRGYNINMTNTPINQIPEIMNDPDFDLYNDDEEGDDE